MNIRSTSLLTLGCGLVSVLALSPAQAQELDEATRARIEKAERGPATIDVSKYPEKIQDYYRLFSQKCSQCHKLSRPINSEYAIPEEWSRYIKRMYHKPGSNISASQAKKIFDFLVYDSSVRKKALLEKKMAKLKPKEKTAAEDKIKEVRGRFDKK